MGRETALSCFLLCVALLGGAWTKSLHPLDSSCRDPIHACRGFVEAHSCGAVSACINDVWTKLDIPKNDKSEICDICKEMVKEARDQLLSNETQEELREVFEGSCNLIPIKPIAAACRQIVDEIIPQLVEMLASEMDPNTVCTVSGLCNVDVLPRLIEGKSLPSLPESDVSLESPSVRKCSGCKLVFGVVKQVIATTNMKDIEKLLMKFCKKEYQGDKMLKCDLKVTEYYPLIHLFLKDMNTETVCRKIQMCAADTASQTLIVLPPGGKQGDDLTCEFCESLVQHAKDMITSNSTVEQFRQALLNFCKLLGNFKDECTQLVTEYYDKFFDFIKESMDPQMLCTLMGLCNDSKPMTKIVEALPSDQHQMVPMIKLVPAKSISGPQVDIFLPDVNTKESKYETNSVHAVPLTKSGIHKLFDPNLGCLVCKDVVNLLRHEVERNETEAALKSALKRGCTELPKSMVKECYQLVDEFLDTLLGLLSQELDPEQVCAELRACDETTDSRMPILQNPLQPVGIPNEKEDKKEADVDCELCKEVVAFLQQELKDNKTEDAIREALEKVCSLLPDSMREECRAFIDQYATQLMHVLAQEIGPDEVCTLLGLCNGGGLPLVCTMCQDVLHFVQNRLMDQKREEQIKNYLKEVCDTLPKSLQDECRAYIEEYGNGLIVILAQEIDPSVVCPAVKLCPANAVKKVDLTINMDGCGLCEVIVEYIDKILENDRVDQDLTKLMEKVCGALPSSVRQDCEVIIKQYAPYILQMIGQVADSKALCTALDLCKRPPGHVHLLGAEKCTFGPSYWCASRAHASACKAEKFCHGVWEAKQKKQ